MLLDSKYNHLHLTCIRLSHTYLAYNLDPDATEVRHPGDKSLDDLQQSWVRGYDQHGGHDQEENREDQLHTLFVRPLFGFLTAARSHEIGMGPQGVRDTGPEPVGLNHD